MVKTTNERMLAIISHDVVATDEEIIEAWTMYFKLYGVTVCNPDGTYKLLYEVLEEAHNIICK